MTDEFATRRINAHARARHTPETRSAVVKIDCTGGAARRRLVAHAAADLPVQLLPRPLRAGAAAVPIRATAAVVPSGTPLPQSLQGCRCRVPGMAASAIDNGSGPYRSARNATPATWRRPTIRAARPWVYPFPDAPNPPADAEAPADVPPPNAECPGLERPGHSVSCTRMRPLGLEPRTY